MEEEKVRLFVGGLGPDVTAAEVQERLTPLGRVHNVTLVSAKHGPGHRGFAYADFVPATDASLRKLFSAYNGCKWRGGVLRIEKAKEHFADLLQREWTAESAASTANGDGGTHKISKQNAVQKESNRANRGNGESNALKIFFPRLGKLKAVPSTGLGKHRRSFQRVESSPLHLLSTCACDEGPGKRSQSTPLSRTLAFAFDSTGTSSGKDQVMEADAIDVGGTYERKGQVGGGGNILPWPSLAHVREDFRKAGQPGYLSQSSKGESTLGKEEGEKIVEDDDDTASLLFAEERLKQLELMHRLFPEDGLAAREVEHELEHRSKNTKRNRKKEVPSNGANRETLKTTVESRTAELFQMVDVDPSTGQRSKGHQEMNMEPDEAPVSHDLKRKSRSVHKAKRAKRSDEQSDNPRDDESDTMETGDADSVAIVTAELQDEQPLQRTSALMSEDVSHEDPEMVLNLGDDSVPIVIVEERERQALRSVPSANDLVEEELIVVPERVADSLSLAVAGEPAAISDEVEEFDAEQRFHQQGASLEIAHHERQEPSSSEELVSEDSADGITMALHMGSDSIPLSIAEEQERKVLMAMLGVDSKSSRRAPGSVTQTRGDRLQGTGEVSGFRGRDIMTDVDLEFDVSKETVSGPTTPQALESSPTEEASRCEISGEVGNVEPLKQAPLADFGHSRENEGSIEASGDESNSKRIIEVRRGRDEEKVSNPALLIEEERSETASQRQANIDNSMGQKQDAPPSSGQNLTRATWKALVGETGHVVFSLRQLTGSAALDVNLQTQETARVDDRRVKKEPIFKSTSERQVEKISSSSRSHIGKGNGTVVPSGQFAVKPAEILPTPVTSADQCLFMKSENAEEEWLASKSQLRSNYRAKHKHAARNVKKLWGKRT